MKKILFIIGSTRKQSFNHQIASYAAAQLEGKAEVEWLNYEDVPFVNQDIEFPAPAPVARVRKAVEAADLLYIFSPEYNYSYPGLLKNLLDWLSRPLDFADPELKTSIRGKKVALAGIGGKNKTKDCREKLVALLDFLGAPVIAPQVGLHVNDEAWTSNEVVLSDEQKAELDAQVKATLEA